MSGDIPELYDWALAPGRETHPNAFKRLGMVTLLYAHRVLFAALLALPPTLWISEHMAAFPNALQAIFSPGGFVLVELHRFLRGVLLSFIAQGSIVAIAGALLGLIPFACLIVALCFQGPLRLRFVLARASASLPSLTLLWGSALLLQISLSGLILMLGEQALSLFSLSFKSADLIRIALVLLSLAALTLVSILHDLARILAVSEEQGFYMAIFKALAAFNRAPAPILWAYGLRAFLSLALLFGAALSTWTRASQSPLAFAVAALVSQIALYLSVLIRASWLARAASLLAFNFLEKQRLNPA